MLQILEEIRADQKLAHSVQWSDGNKIRDGVLKRASEEMIQHAAEFTVSEDQVAEKVAEMINTPGRDTWSRSLASLPFSTDNVV